MTVSGGVRAGWRAVGTFVSITAAGWLPMSTCAAAETDARILNFEPLQIRVPHSATNAQQKAGRALDKLELSVFGRDYSLSVETNETFHASLAAKPSRSTLTLYRGSIDGLTISWVRLATQGTDVHGMVWDGTDLYVIAPTDQVREQLVPPIETSSAGVIFRLRDVLMPTHEASCAAEASASIERGSDSYASLVRELQHANAKGELGATMRLELAVLADALFLDRYVDERAARDSILIRLNNIDGIYSSQLGVQIQAPQIDIFDASSTTLSNTTNADSLLRELARAREKSLQQRARGLTHLFTGRDLQGTTVGIAYVDALCDPKFGVGLTEVSTRGAWYESLIAAHEIGHNFGAVHDGEAGKACASTPQGAFLMSPNVNGVDAFSNCSLDMMRPKIATARCIKPLPAANVRVEADLGTLQRPAATSFDYELPVTNAGGATAMNVRAEILVPPVIEVEDAYVIGGSCTSGGGIVQCQLGNIAGGTSRPVYLTFRGTVVGTSSIAVRVFADNEPNTSDNQGSGTLAIEREADVSVSIEAPERVTTATGFQVRFTVANATQIAAHEVRTSLHLPAGVTATAAAQTGGTCAIEDSEIACVVPTLGAGESSAGRITLSAGHAGLALLQIQTSGSYVDPVGSNDAAEATVEVTQSTPPSAVQSDDRGAGGNRGGGGAFGAFLLGALGILNLWRKLTKAA